MEGPSIIFTLALMWACAAGGVADDQGASSTQSNVGLALKVEADAASNPSAEAAVESQREVAPAPQLFKRPTLATGGSPGSQESRVIGTPGVGGAWYRSGLVSLVAVLALIGALFWAVRKFMPGAVTRAGGVMNVAARTALSPKHSVALVQVGRRRFVLVGISADRLTTLADMADADEVAELAGLTMGGSSASDRKFERELTQASRAFEPAELVEPAPADDKSRRVSDARGQLETLLARLKGKNAA